LAVVSKFFQRVLAETKGKKNKFEGGIHSLSKELLISPS
jgi:hypothetical protein